MHFLKVISFVENLFCVYRNYTCFNKLAQKFILLRVMFEIIFIVLNMINSHFKEDLTTGDLIFFHLNALNSLVILLLAIYHAGSNKKIVMYFKSFLLHFPNKIDLEKKSEVLQRVLVAIALLYCLFKLCYTLYFHFAWLDGTIDLNFVYNLILQVVMYICDLRFVVEFYVMCCGVNAIAEQLAVIVKEIENSYGIYDMGKVSFACGNICTSISRDCKKHLQQCATWSAAYETVKKCSELCNSIFGFQITLMLATTSIYYIILLYSMTTMSVEGEFTPVMKFMYSICLAEFIIALYILSQAAQRARNSAEALRRRLATLLIHSLECEKQYKATRDLLRLVSTHPIQTKAFGSITVDMTLLPTCVAFCTSYTVVALQFNNIL